MLQSIRNKASSWFALAILFLALFSLTFFGIGDYFTTRTDTFVAKVGDEEISQEAFRERFQQWRQQQRQAMGDAFDPRVFDQPVFRRQILDQMIDETVLRQAGERLGLVVPRSRIVAEVSDIPAFQVGGSFSPQSYVSLLSRQGMTPRMFEDRLHDDIQARVMPLALLDSTLVTDAEVDERIRLGDQLRSFRFLRVTEPEGEVDAVVDEAQRQAYYDEHSAEFMTPETVTIEYVELDADQLDLVLDASEAVLRERYTAEVARFSTPEERSVAHILIRAEGGDADAQRAALDKAQGLAEQARAEGADFAALAREHSDDLGSREGGGDLGWLARGQMDPAFEDAAFEAEAGVVTDPVRSDDGFHVILVREIRAATQRPFEEVRDELTQDFLAAERERTYSERAGELTDLVYEHSDALAPVAEAMGLVVKREGPYTRTTNSGLFANPAVRDAAFSEELLNDGVIGDPIDLSPTRRVALRVVEHVPAAPQPLADVAASIDERIVAERRADAVRARAEALLERLQSGESLADLASEIGGEVETADGTGRYAASPEQPLVAGVFRMPRDATAEAPQRQRIALGDSHALVELTAVVDGDPAAADEARRTQVREQIQRGRASAESQALIAALRAQAEITVAEERM